MLRCWYSKNSIRVIIFWVVFIISAWKPFDLCCRFDTNISCKLIITYRISTNKRIQCENVIKILEKIKGHTSQIQNYICLLIIFIAANSSWSGSGGKLWWTPYSYVYVAFTLIKILKHVVMHEDSISDYLRSIATSYISWLTHY